MREALAPYVNTRQKFRATVETTGTDAMGQITVLLTNVVLVGQGTVADHCWVRWSRALMSSHLRMGERIAFKAKVAPYVKRGGQGDYRLVSLKDIKRR